MRKEFRNKHTAIRILFDVSRFGVDHGLDQLSEIVVMGQEFVEMRELVACVSKPLSSAETVRGENSMILNS